MICGTDLTSLIFQIERPGIIAVEEQTDADPILIAKPLDDRDIDRQSRGLVLIRNTRDGQPLVAIDPRQAERSAKGPGFRRIECQGEHIIECKMNILSAPSNGDETKGAERKGKVFDHNYR